MDALTHAIEAYVSTLNCPFTDPLALQAIEMVLDYLPASFNGNKTAREEMHYAQCLAGMAFSNALLGIVHSMAHKTGAAFSTGHIPHGCANAIYLPYVIKYNAKDPVAAKRYAEIARRMGLSGTSEKAFINSLCEQNWPRCIRMIRSSAGSLIFRCGWKGFRVTPQPMRPGLSYPTSPWRNTCRCTGERRANLSPSLT